jgi:predicted ester cyclase
MDNPSRRIFEEVWNRKNPAIIDELMAPDYVHHDVLSPEAFGLDGYKQFADRYLSAFPNLQMTIHDEVVAGDRIVTRWTATGTHDGDLPGLPRTGKNTLAGIEKYFIRVLARIRRRDNLNLLDKARLCAFTHSRLAVGILSRNFSSLISARHSLYRKTGIERWAARRLSDISQCAY